MGVVELAAGGVFLMLGALIAIELFAPARWFEDVSGWRLKCIAFIPMIIAISTYVPIALAAQLESFQLLPGHRLGVAGGTIVGIAASEFVIYWAHRLHHQVPVLWRWIHQIHHSAERVDVFGAAYFHPFEILEGAVIGVVFFSTVLGLAPEATALAILWQAFAGVFQHGNIRTPRWLGYFIQRPEAHCVHHERGLHAYNYANLPIWDMIFGTFKNPAAWQGLAGFYPGSSRPTLAMLAGRDISNDGAPG